MKFMILIGVATFFHLASTLSAPIDLDVALNRVQSEISHLEQDLRDIELSVFSLDNTQNRLSSELVEYEGELGANMKRAIVPLLNWPERVLSFQATTWAEHQRAELVLRSVKDRVIARPMKLVDERRLRINEVSGLREELSLQLKQLQMKQSLLDFQLEELEMLQRRSQVDLPQATGRKKNMP